MQVKARTQSKAAPSSSHQLKTDSSATTAGNKSSNNGNGVTLVPRRKILFLSENEQNQQNTGTEISDDHSAADQNIMALSSANPLEFSR